jgi:hypothetical protein
MAWTTPGTAVAGDVLTASFWNLQVRDQLNSLVEAGTALPSSPVDGQSFYYVANATDGVVWHLRYRAASSSAYKWEFVGGQALTSQVLTTQSLGATVGSYIDVATVGPSVTNPLAGDYLVEWGIRGVVGATESIIGAGIKFGSAAAPVDANVGTQYAISGGGVAATRQIPAVFGSDVKTSLAVSTLVKVQYYQNNTNCFVGNRFLKLTPIRVG